MYDNINTHSNLQVAMPLLIFAARFILALMVSGIVYRICTKKILERLNKITVPFLVAILMRKPLTINVFCISIQVKARN